MKRRMKLNLLLCFVSVAFFAEIQAQKAIGNEKPEVKVIGTVTQDAIMLRWGMNTPTSWKYANQYGFKIVRETIAKGDSLLKTPIIKTLNDSPIKPRPLEEWEGLVDDNDYAAIAAQSLYGDDFEVEMENAGNDLLSILNQAEALEQRFSYALFAADQDFKVALHSGLGFVDNDIKKDEKYLYKIYVLIPEDKMQVKFGGVFLGANDYRELPKPIDFVGVFGDRTVQLTWNYELLKRTFNNYIIERSDDAGKTYNRLENSPIVNLNEKEDRSTDRMFYLDTIPVNNKTYYYRVKGISPFGLIGPPSEVISGKGQKPLETTPAIINANLVHNQVVISWEFPEGNESISHFEINKSNHIKEGYQIVQQNIDKKIRTTTISNLEVINYFTITAVGIDGSKRVSFPKMVQLDDNEPPAKPSGLSATIDSTGVVKLSWNLNSEIDFMGYRVFKANLSDEEFTQITFKPIPNATFTDTVHIKTLNNKVYYKVQAFDQRYNPSAFSEILEIKKPDVIPPTKPVFKSFEVDKGIVTLTWVNSSSIDALKTAIYRKEKGKDEPWQLISEITLPENTYKDATAIPTINYIYTLITIDESGLESEPITPLTIKVPDNGLKPEIEKFNATVNREERYISINWRYKENNISEYRLYKSEEDLKPTLYKVLEKDEDKYTDRNLKINTKYNYMIQAVYASGAKSPIKKIEVVY